MRKLIGSAVLVAVLVCAASPATAQQPKVSYGVAAGLAMPMGDYGDLDKLGFTFGAGASFALGSAPVRLRIEGSWSQTSHDDVGGSPVEGNTKILGGMASLVYPFQTAGTVKPYVLAGLGYYNVDFEFTGVGSADESKVGFGGGAGVRFPLSSASLFLEGRFMSVSTSGSSTTWVPIIVGISLGR